MSRSGDICADDRQTNRRTKPIALPLAHACGVVITEYKCTGADFKDMQMYTYNITRARKILT